MISQTKPLMMLKLGILKSNLMTNRLVLSGTVCRTPLRKVSPSGIPHCQFVLSIVLCRRKPAFTGRRGAKCPLLLADTKTRPLHSITVGSRITVQGFISCHKAKNGLSKMVLHAEQIQSIDSGD
ncbi:primosomal replication protein N [Shigella sonnei]